MGLMIAAGAMLPALYAFSALFLSKLAAACAAFVLSRTLLRSRAQAALARYPRMARVLARSSLSSSNGVASASLDTNSTTGWKFVALMRLSPFPGFVLNYLLSLTDVSFVNYLFGSVVGMAPPILNLVLIGNAARQVGAEVSGGSGISTSSGAANATGSSGTWSALAQWLPIALKLITIFSMIAITVHVSRAIASAFGEDDDDSINTATISAAGENNNNNASGLNDKAQNGNGRMKNNSNNGVVTEGVVRVDVDSDVNPTTTRSTDAMAMPVATTTMLRDDEVVGCEDEASSTGNLSLRLSTNEDSGNDDCKGSTDTTSHVAAKSVL